VWVGVVAMVTLGTYACGVPSSGDAVRGRELFPVCAACHGSKGEGNADLQAPNIAGLPAWYVEGQLRQFLGGYRGGVPADSAGRRMSIAAQVLTQSGDEARDVASVALYVSRLPAERPAATLPPGDPARGKVEYQACASCHGADGRGKYDVPPLLAQADWYLLAQLRKYREAWRGTNANDLQASRMRAVVIPLDDGAMEDVVAYIGTLR
jgi:cytochrome c oxidase subunit 2